MSHLKELEAETSFILRECLERFSRPTILFSGGKDSTVLAHLARRALWPGPFAFRLLHIDTGYNFQETLLFRDRLGRALGAELVVRSVEDSIKSGRAKEIGLNVFERNALQSVSLVDAIEEYHLDCVIGGARRDEDKARAKERYFSLRRRGCGWIPNEQRPEFWNLFNLSLQPGDHFRVFPLNNWTEIDIWNYIATHKVEIPSMYYAHRRSCLRLPNGQLFAFERPWKSEHGQGIEERVVRCRTVGDVTCTAFFESHATTASDVLCELENLRTSERSGRLDDSVSEYSMEDRKTAGYF